jgi:hypothetical protein
MKICYVREAAQELFYAANSLFFRRLFLTVHVIPAQAGTQATIRNHYYISLGGRLRGHDVHTPEAL